jgi:hypothetical protein
MAADFILNECSTVLATWLDLLLAILLMNPRKSQEGHPWKTKPTNRPRTPKPLHEIKVYSLWDLKTNSTLLRGRSQRQSKNGFEKV